MDTFAGSGYTTAQLTVMLNEAQAAYAAFATGTKVVEIQRDGRVVKYNMVNIHQLKSYITELQGSIGVESTIRSRRGLGFKF